MSGDHRIEIYVLAIDTVIGQHHHIVVGVVSAFGQFGRLHQWPQAGEDKFQGKLSALFVTDGDIPGTAGRHGKAEANQVCPHGIQCGCFGVEGEAPRLFKNGDQGFQLLFGLDGLIIAAGLSRWSGGDCVGCRRATGHRRRQSLDDVEHLQLGQQVHH